MKKFITYISRQKAGNLLSGCYIPHGNEKLRMGWPCHFPVVAMINGYTESGDHIQIYTMYGVGNTEYQDNLRVLEEDVRKIQKEKDFEYEIIPIPVSEEEVALEHLKTFVELTDVITDDDQIYLCITYGSKPTPIVEMMALNFTYQIRDNVSVECIVYGKVNHNAVPKTFDIYDITPLFNMSQITSELAKHKVSDPVGYVKEVLNLTDEGED